MYTYVYSSTHKFQTYTLLSLEFEELFLNLALPRALDGKEVVETCAGYKLLVFNVLQSPQNLCERRTLGVLLLPACCVCVRV